MLLKTKEIDYKGGSLWLFVDLNNLLFALI